MLLLMLFLLLVIYPFFITYNMNNHTKIKESSAKEVIKNICFVILVSLIVLVIFYFLIEIYEDYIPSSNSSTCYNTGGWTYSCTGNQYIAAIVLSVMELIMIAHHFIVQRFIYKIFEYSNKVVKYIFMYCYIFIIYILSFWLIMFLFGLFTTIHFNSIFIEILRIIVVFTPTLLFTISLPIYAKKSKNK